MVFHSSEELNLLLGARGNVSALNNNGREFGSRFW